MLKGRTLGYWDIFNFFLRALDILKLTLTG